MVLRDGNHLGSCLGSAHRTEEVRIIQHIFVLNIMLSTKPAVNHALLICRRTDGAQQEKEALKPNHFQDLRRVNIYY